MDRISQNLYKYMISGVIESGIWQDGGDECYNQIPLYHHISFVVILSLLHIWLLVKFTPQLKTTLTILQPSVFQRRFAIISLLSWLMTLYFKLQTHKGLFMFNPCHMAVLIQTYLLMNKNTSVNRLIYNHWTGWLFGAYMAIMVPHINGINHFQIFLYFYQHVVLIPFGFIVLAKRYGFLKPNLKNQLAAFTTMALHQVLILAPLSRYTKVNLNFALCHSPADPLFDTVGCYYFVICAFGLNLLSYIFRWVSYFIAKVFYFFLGFIGIQQAKDIKEGNNQNSEDKTPKDD